MEQENKNSWKQKQDGKFTFQGAGKERSIRVFLVVIKSDNLAGEPKHNLPWDLKAYCI